MSAEAAGGAGTSLRRGTDGAECPLESACAAPTRVTPNRESLRNPGDKRDSLRVPLDDGPVEGEVMVFQPMTVVNLSLGGAQIETDFALQIASVHDFRLALADGSVVVRGRVVHCHIDDLTEAAATYRIGVAFVDVSEHARIAIDDFVRAMAIAQSTRDADGFASAS